MELALGDHSRSGGQYDIWQAVFGPAGADGYPTPIFDKVTGDIDPAIAAYWREHYDLSHIIERDWATLAPKLQGKIHIYVGIGDNYYPDQRGLLRPGPAGGAEARLGGRGRLRRPRRALLERRPEPCPTPIRACTTTSSTCRRSWSASVVRAGRGPDELAISLRGAEPDGLRSI